MGETFSMQNTIDLLDYLTMCLNKKRGGGYIKKHDEGNFKRRRIKYLQDLRDNRIK